MLAQTFSTLCVMVLSYKIEIRLARDIALSVNQLCEDIWTGSFGTKQYVSPRDFFS